jgi:hypothetical protein
VYLSFSSLRSGEISCLPRSLTSTRTNNGARGNGDGRGVMPHPKKGSSPSLTVGLGFPVEDTSLCMEQGLTLSSTILLNA